MNPLTAVLVWNSAQVRSGTRTKIEPVRCKNLYGQSGRRWISHSPSFSASRLQPNITHVVRAGIGVDLYLRKIRRSSCVPHCPILTEVKKGYKIALTDNCSPEMRLWKESPSCALFGYFFEMETLQQFKGFISLCF